MTRNYDITQPEGARMHLARKARSYDADRVISRKEREAAVVILTDWITRTRPRQFRFADAVAELKGDHPLTKKALQLMHGSGLLDLNNRVYYPTLTKGATQW